MLADFDRWAPAAGAALSRVVIGDVGSPDLTGRRAEDLCSRNALLALAADRGLSGLRPSRLADDLARAAASPDAATQRSASATLAAFGRHLGALIATLRHPDTPGKQGTTPAWRTYLAQWLTVDRIWLTGGLLAGGAQVVESLAAASGAAAALPCRVSLAPHPTITPLLGAASLVADGGPDDVIVVADCGQTGIRTAVVQGNAMTVTGIRIARVTAAPAGRSADEVEDILAAELVSVGRQAVRARPAAPRIRILVSLAAHVAGGLPVDDGEGIYGCLAGRAGSLRRRIAVACGAEAALRFVHDGTAAAAVGAPGSATLLLGTWPGSGFRSAPGPPVRELAPDLIIRWP